MPFLGVPEAGRCSHWTSIPASRSRLGASNSKIQDVAKREQEQGVVCRAPRSLGTFSTRSHIPGEGFSGSLFRRATLFHAEQREVGSLLAGWDPATMLFVELLLCNVSIPRTKRYAISVSFVDPLDSRG
jgi:hypothetical protein